MPSEVSYGHFTSESLSLYSLSMQACVLVRGRYIVEMRLLGYDNPTQRCQDCPIVQSVDRSCMGTDRCDSYFIYCLRTIGSIGRDCSYFGIRMSSANTDDMMDQSTSVKAQCLVWKIHFSCKA